MVYQKACEIDPIEKRKKPVIVTEVYDPPLPAETDRGRSGEYIKLLRPLLLSQVAFEGKLCALCNLMELFDAYMEVLKENPIVKIKLAVIKNESDLDIWKPELYPKIGERYYVSILKGNLRRRIKYALDSLQGQGIVRWKEITRIVPDICTETDEGTEERPETIGNRRAYRRMYRANPRTGRYEKFLSGCRTGYISAAVSLRKRKALELQKRANPTWEYTAIYSE